MKWYELSESEQLERIAKERERYRSMSDIELLKDAAFAAVDTLTMWMEADDTAASIARDAVLYSRNLKGPARRIIPEYEEWHKTYFGGTYTEDAYDYYDDWGM